MYRHSVDRIFCCVVCFQFTDHKRPNLAPSLLSLPKLNLFVVLLSIISVFVSSHATYTTENILVFKNVRENNIKFLVAFLSTCDVLFLVSQISIGIENGISDIKNSNRIKYTLFCWLYIFVYKKLAICFESHNGHQYRKW